MPSANVYDVRAALSVNVCDVRATGIVRDVTTRIQNNYLIASLDVASVVSTDLYSYTGSRLRYAIALAEM